MLQNKMIWKYLVFLMPFSFLLFNSSYAAENLFELEIRLEDGGTANPDSNNTAVMTTRELIDSVKFSDNYKDEDDSFFEKQTKKNLAIMLPIFVALDFMPGALQHESLHALTAMAYGKKVDRITIWPEKWEFKDGTTMLLWGRYELDEGQEVKDHEQAMISVAPYLGNLTVMSIYSSLYLTKTLPKNKFAQLGLWTFSFGNWVDSLQHPYASIRNTGHADMNKFYKSIGVEPNSAEGISLTVTQFLIAAAGGVLHGFALYDIFKDAPDKMPDDKKVDLSYYISFGSKYEPFKVGIYGRFY